jgi:hypothetical protein
MSLHDEIMKIEQLKAALNQASFCLRELLPNDSDAIFTVDMINKALNQEKK